MLTSFHSDNIAQEPNETFTLTLDPLIQPNPRTGLFFQDAIQMSIVDNDCKLSLAYFIAYIQVAM